MKKTEKASAYIAAHWPYRRSESKWAGGDHTVTVQLTRQLTDYQRDHEDYYDYITRPGVRAGSTTVWSDNGKWTGTNSFCHIVTDRQTLRLFPRLMTADHAVVLIRARQIGHREYRATWLEQSRGCSLRPVEGWIIRGHHVTAATIEKARKKVRKIRAAAAKTLVGQHIDRAHLRQVWVGVSDSLAGGNCQVGTSQACRDIEMVLGASGEVGAVRADWLLAYRDDLFTRRAVLAAQARYEV